MGANRKNNGQQRWENEGGSVGPRAVAGDRAPVLPPGYVVQPVREELDASGRYEFNHVYGLPKVDGRGAVTLLEEDLCYWRMTSMYASEPQSHYVTYAQARARWPKLRFGQFASFSAMTGELWSWLREPRLETAADRAILR